MKITLYELLGLVKDGKAPKKVKFNGLIWTFNEYFNQYQTENGGGNIWNGFNFNILNDKVEIIEEEKKIPEKIEICKDEEGYYFMDNHCKKIYISCEGFNQLIDCIKSKGE